MWAKEFRAQSKTLLTISLSSQKFSSSSENCTRHRRRNHSYVEDGWYSLQPARWVFGRNRRSQTGSKHTTNGFGAIDIILVIVILGLVGFIGVYVYRHRADTKHASQTAQTETPPAKSTGSAPQIPAISSSIWSGYVGGFASPGSERVDAHGKTTPTSLYNYVQGEFNVPTSFSCEDPDNAIAIWVGIDGSNIGGTVEQSGVYVGCNPHNSSATYMTFAAIHSGGDYVTNQLKVGPDDKIFASVQYTKGAYYFTIKNLTAGTQWTGHQNCRYDPCHRASAEWVVEDQNNNALGEQNQADIKVNLGKFSPITFSDAYAATDDGKFQPISELEPSKYILTGSGSAQPYIDQITSLNGSGTGFTVSWLRSH